MIHCHVACNKQFESQNSTLVGQMTSVYLIKRAITSTEVEHLHVHGSDYSIQFADKQYVSRQLSQREISPPYRRVLSFSLRV